MIKRIFVAAFSLFCGYVLVTSGSGCAQIGFPTGGDRDSTAPALVRAVPAQKSLNVTSNRIALTFDEYIDVQELQNNLLVSPVQKNNPVITFNRRTINIRLRDSLQPNTTYSINFGEAIRDINEGNKLRNFTYLFSAGNTIDSLELTGKVILAETGKTDSAIQVLLYRNADDSAVRKRKPDYISRLDGAGNFRFGNLPAASFKVYALLDGDGGKTYNSPSEVFGFLDSSVTVSASTAPVTLYAYAAEPPRQTTPPKPAVEKRLRYTNNLEQGAQSLLDSLRLSFNNKLKTVDLSRIHLTDTNYNPLNAGIRLDSLRRNIAVGYAWSPDASYVLILPKEAIQDTIGNSIARNDTLKFRGKKNEDYGRVILRFPNLDLGKHPVIQFVQNDQIIKSYPITSAEWSDKRFPPGEYDVRILYDSNGNGKWDPGDYNTKRQPEIGITLPQKLSIRADWDNEREVRL